MWMAKQDHFARVLGDHLLPLTEMPDDLALLLRLYRAAPAPLRRQLLEQLREAVLRGRLAPGRRLPATRTLAAALRISRNLAEVTYDELAVQGYLVRRHGSGTFVASDMPRLPRPVSAVSGERPRWLRGAPSPRTIPPLPPDAIVFGLGVPDVTAIPASLWRAIWRSAGEALPPAEYGQPAGDTELRAALAEYLRRARGLACAPEDVIVTTSAMQALDLLARVTLAPGDAVAFEEPGYVMARQALAGHGARIVPIPVDEDGMDVAALAREPEAPLLAYVTPSHQYPLGGRLPVTRRMALLAWAERHDSLIVEDDYDSEYRYDAPPLPALRGLDQQGRVAYIGTFSKMLTPALRVGYLVAPTEALRQRIEHIKSVSDYAVSWPVQRALLALLAEGHLDRHIRRMRRQYAEKRALLRRLLEPLAPVAQLRGLEAGLHVFLELRADVDVNEIARQAWAHGVVATSLDRFYVGTPNRRGLVLGYGGLTLSEIAHGAGVLRESIADMAGVGSR
jgi:GntR family transcriptional regulator/MocR family aminotransferase